MGGTQNRMLARVFSHKITDSGVDLFEADSGDWIGGAELSGSDEVKFKGEIPEEMKRTLTDMLGSKTRIGK